MASVESVPVYMLPGIPVAQPSHLEGDASLATEILPGPPPLASVQHAGQPRKDHRKTLTVLSYLPASDPGTTYAGHMAAPLASAAEAEGPRRKRARLERSSVASRAQRASARNLNATASVMDASAHLEPMASSSHLVPDTDPTSLALDSDDPALSRSNSVPLGEDPVPGQSHARGGPVARKDKGKGRERDAAVRIKEEPTLGTLPLNDYPATGQPKRRIPKATATPIDITKPRQSNNGNIEIIQLEPTPAAPSKMTVDEVLINGRRYRVPERVITLDFWTKVGRGQRQYDERTDDTSALSSPLTSLTSLAGDDDDHIPAIDPSIPLFSLEDIRVAQLLAGLHLSHGAPSSSTSPPPLVSNGVNGTFESAGASQSNVRDGSLNGTRGRDQVNGAAKPIVKKEPTASNSVPGADTSKADASKARQTPGMRPQSARRSARGDDDDYRPNNRVTLPAASASARRPRGRKDEAKQEANHVHATEATAPADSVSQAVLAGNHALTANQVELPAPSGTSISARPRKGKRRARRRASPGQLGPRNGGNANDGWDTVDSEEPDTPLALSLTRIPSGSKQVDHVKKEPQSRGVASTPSVPSSKVSAPPVSSTAKTGETTPSLKIRLPGLAHLNRAALSTLPKPTASADSRELPSVSTAPSRGRAPRTPRASAAVAPRERRSSRRDRTSTSVSLHEAPAANDADH
ncbi:hypothetical protein EVJ58_g2787 [Rhodofomes roseus]|uniref:Uncharacterized protein n=1 Tax=Rhodofomes roseus TaxID=34475 RepID=A0A4Y9YP21_9APHY|nr:hypothetical protein EVJ58_g2787 [Rhodofomes roseus]